MTRLHLTVLPDGKCLVTSEDRLPREEQEQISQKVEEWVTGASPILVIDDCDVVRMEAPG